MKVFVFETIVVVLLIIIACAVGGAEDIGFILGWIIKIALWIGAAVIAIFLIGILLA